MKDIEKDSFPIVLRVEDVQRILGVGKNNAYEIFHRPDFPAKRIGNVLRVSRDAFFKWLEEK